MDADSHFADGTTFGGIDKVIAVTDTGLDLGLLHDMHPAFQDRVLDPISVGRQGQADDPHGHGTHVSGSVLGNSLAAQGEGELSGTAPAARLVLQSLLNENQGLFSHNHYPLGELLLGPYHNNKARIYNNSWGGQMVRLPAAVLRRVHGD